MDDVGERLMTSHHPPLDLPIEVGTPVAASPRRPDVMRLAMVIPTLLAAAAVAVSLDGALMLIAIVVVLSFAFIGAWFVQQSSLPADAVVLVGRNPMASVIASALEAQVGRGRWVLRAQSMVEAASLVRASRCNEVILAGSFNPGGAPLIDARARRPVVLNGAEKLERLLGRVPLEFATLDRFLNSMGPVRHFDRGYAVAKHGLDLLIGIGMGPAILPLLPIIALAIKLDSSGSILYTQQRVGLGGRVFRIYKFRTLQADAERNGAVWAAEKDPRVTRVGRFMRLTRIDGLPQLWNVVRGDMSFVGPRPERPEFTRQLAEALTGYDLRHAVKPGLTGWAQVCYRYTSSIKDTRAKVEYDLYYVKHAWLRLDLAILWRTIGVVVGMRGR
ncbi:MAG TPA: sugar transferase [Thermomicrobiales bacterium]|nr:sugar transferase [Thermomicrobiales bacterium]